MDKCLSVSAEFPKNWDKGEAIWRGKYGNVFLVVDKDNPQDKKFVVKELPVSSSKRVQSYYKRERKTLSLLNHERIVPFYGFDELYSFFGYMKKGSLADYVAEENGLSEEKTRLFTRQILEGVNYLHSQKPSIIHNNIKGRHVLLEDENNIRLSGFGLAQTVHDFTNARTEVGTDKWMAPEVVTAAGNECYGVKIDIWSVACTVVEMISKEPPFLALLPAEMMFRMAQRCFPTYFLPEATSEALRNFLTRTFKYDPVERPTSEDLLRDVFITGAIQLIDRVADSSTNLSITCTSENFSDKEISKNTKTDELPQISKTAIQSNPREDPFFDILKRYWSTIVKITGQPLLLEYYHKSNHNISPWFERVKKSSVTKTLELLIKEESDVDLGIFKDFSTNKMTDALIFTSLVLSYNNRLLDTLNKPRLLQGKQVEELIDVVEAVSSALTRFQALLPWSVSAWLNEVDGHIGTLKSKVDHMSCIHFNKQQLEELNFGQNRVVYDVDILCSVLGLDPEFSKFSKQIDVDTWLHDLQTSRVLNWVKRNRENIQQYELSNEFMHQVNVVKLKLILLGFTECKAASILDDIPEDWINHQSALDLATSHILDMFQCHPVLTEVSGFPYNNKKTDVFFDQSVQLGTKQAESAFSIKMINVSDSNNKKVRTDIQTYIKEMCNDDYVTFFHGSSRNNIVSILTRGIVLDKGGPSKDFSHRDGFYVSYVFSHAKNWAAYKSKTPAIIVYRIATSTLQRFTELCLDENMDQWCRFIKYWRNFEDGAERESFFSNYDCIVGPMCMNPEQVVPPYNQVPKKHNPVMKQMCIRGKSMAAAFNLPEHIVCVIFYKETIK